MGRSTRTNHAKVKVWTENMISDFEGPIAACVSMLFIAVPMDKQPALIERLQSEYKARADKKQLEAA
jgi:hypothetical protein